MNDEMEKLDKGTYTARWAAGKIRELEAELKESKLQVELMQTGANVKILLESGVKSILLESCQSALIERDAKLDELVEELSFAVDIIEESGVDYEEIRTAKLISEVTE
jgi:hypothetical protein|tara:strand:+ start:4592 stop:4915 length:324 start_codon:yes stop_codon:yes gene_type:complete